MATVRINPDLIEIDGVTRVERGPKTCVAIATEALLDDAVTANHYQVGSPDALGKPIVLGEEMTYRDWIGDHWYHVYALEKSFDEFGGKWIKCGEFATEAEAVSEATKIAIQLSAKEQA